MRIVWRVIIIIILLYSTHELYLIAITSWQMKENSYCYCYSTNLFSFLLPLLFFTIIMSIENWIGFQSVYTRQYAMDFIDIIFFVFSSLCVFFLLFQFFIISIHIFLVMWCSRTILIWFWIFIWFWIRHCHWNFLNDKLTTSFFFVFIRRNFTHFYFLHVLKT